MFFNPRATKNLFIEQDLQNVVLCNLEGEILCSNKMDQPEKFASLASHIWSLYLQFPTIDISQLKASVVKIPTSVPNRGFQQKSVIKMLEIDNENGKVVIFGINPNFLLAGKHQDGRDFNKLHVLAKLLSLEVKE